MDGPQDIIPISNNSRQNLLEWQQATYHHIQNLATGVLGAIFSGLAVAAAILTTFWDAIPPVPWSDVTEVSVSLLSFTYTIPEPYVTSILAANILGSWLGVVVAGLLLAETIYLLGRIVVGGRLSHAAIEDGTRALLIPESLRTGLDPWVSSLSGESNRLEVNRQQVNDVDRDFRYGLYRIPAALSIAVFYSYVYFTGSELSIFAILFGTIDTLLISILLVYWIATRDPDWDLTQPTKVIWFGLFLANLLILLLAVAPVLS